MSRQVIDSILAEYRRYKAMAEGAMDQLTDDQLHRVAPGGGNSVTAIAWHVAANFRSRFSDFLTADGEKPWRDRESEFAARTPARRESMAYWEAGWTTVFDALNPLTDDDLSRIVRIRGIELSVLEALHRSLAHASYHVGQIVYAGKTLKGGEWRYLTIPPGQSEVYNRNATGEKADAHVARLKKTRKG